MYIVSENRKPSLSGAALRRAAAQFLQGVRQGGKDGGQVFPGPLGAAGEVDDQGAPRARPPGRAWRGGSWPGRRPAWPRAGPAPAAGPPPGWPLG